MLVFEHPECIKNNTSFLINYTCSKSCRSCHGVQCIAYQIFTRGDWRSKYYIQKWRFNIYGH